MIAQGLKFLLVAILSILYWPFNTIFVYLKKHYLKWQKEDMVSFIIATPLYWSFYLIVLVISYPLELLGEGLHPGLETFK